MARRRGRGEEHTLARQGRDAACLLYTLTCLPPLPSWPPQDAFFEDYKESHRKLSELGCDFD